jgi:hypothetical protein
MRGIPGPGTSGRIRSKKRAESKGRVGTNLRTTCGIDSAGFISRRIAGRAQWVPDGYKVSSADMEKCLRHVGEGSVNENLLSSLVQCESKSS